MTLHLYYHPLASFCHKALIAFYENGTAFEPEVVDLGNIRDEAERIAGLGVRQVTLASAYHSTRALTPSTSRCSMLG